jgi:hypothetical protein
MIVAEEAVAFRRTPAPPFVWIQLSDSCLDFHARVRDAALKGCARAGNQATPPCSLTADRAPNSYEWLRQRRRASPWSSIELAAEYPARGGGRNDIPKLADI